MSKYNSSNSLWFVGRAILGRIMTCELIIQFIVHLSFMFQQNGFQWILENWCWLQPRSSSAVQSRQGRTEHRILKTKKNGQLQPVVKMFEATKALAFQLDKKYWDNKKL